MGTNHSGEGAEEPGIQEEVGAPDLDDVDEKEGDGDEEE